MIVQTYGFVKSTIKIVYCCLLFIVKESTGKKPFTCKISVHSRSIGTRLTIGEPTNSKRNIREFTVAIGWFTYR